SVFAPFPQRLWTYAQLVPPEEGESDDRVSHRADIWLIDEGGQVVAEAKGLCVLYLTDDLQVEASPQIDDWLYAIDWQALNAVDTRGQTLRPHWLVFSDGTELGQTLGRELLRRGADVRWIHPGSAAADEPAADARTDCLNHQDPDDVDRVLNAFGLDSAPGVVYLWGNACRVDEGSALADVEQRTQFVTEALIGLLQGFDRRRLPPTLWLLSGGAHAVLGSECPDPAQAMLWGLGRSVAEEHAAAWG
ncbi:MAG: hypothetical protein GY733_23255, partial [bacterium]|nr:hypothetical protein [bacterium]